MNAESFVNGIRKSIVEENLQLYKELFENTAPVNDIYWKEVLGFYSTLTTDQKDSLFKIIRQVEVDTVSNLLGVLDGVSWLENQTSPFIVTEKGKSEQINGNLQDLFIEKEYE